jgi:glycosyltransferase involved in cell wall biosynthesis
LRRILGDRARVILEVHLPPRGGMQRRLLQMVDGVACQSHALRAVLSQQGLVSESRSVGRHGGFSPQLTETARASREDARRQLGWQIGDRIACYTGKVNWRLKELELIVDAAERLTDDGVRVVVVGGREDHVKLWRESIAKRGLTNVEFVGFVAPSAVPLYQMAADVLLLYYERGIPLNDYRSPGKLFEYMASGTPAVVSDYLSIREVIRDGENGLLVPPDRPDLLARAVRRILDDDEFACALACQAREDSTHFTWDATAMATLTLIDRLWDA